MYNAQLTLVYEYLCDLLFISKIPVTRASAGQKRDCGQYHSFEENPKGRGTKTTMPPLFERTAAKQDSSSSTAAPSIVMKDRTGFICRLLILAATGLAVRDDGPYTIVVSIMGSS